jgi:hypothetical protein
MPQKGPSPGEKLAEQVVDALLAKNLIQPHRKSALKSKLINGGCSASDWRIWAEDFARPEDDDAEAAS